jgi:hypothetical protein
MNYLMNFSSVRFLLKATTILMLIYALLMNRCLIFWRRGTTKQSMPFQTPTALKNSSQMSILDSLRISSRSNWGMSCSKFFTKKEEKY